MERLIKGLLPVFYRWQAGLLLKQSVSMSTEFLKLLFSADQKPNSQGNIRHRGGQAHHHRDFAHRYRTKPDLPDKHRRALCVLLRDIHFGVTMRKQAEHVSMGW